MELVKGIPITRFCDERRLTLRERLELAIPVCQAVQHAHQKGIIHRDLKPSNVLIALYDGKPVPKIIDFGVAKATGPRLTDQTLYTEFGAVVGTLEYMSPEQAELNQLDIDTRSDIYSLGVLLYELLTGSTPLEHKRLKAGGVSRDLRVIREEESPRPSMRLSTTEELPSIAACRHVEPRKLSGLVRGELDWIVMKALEKDRNRRYETANGLAADLRRYLNDEAVHAAPPTAAYRLSKFARKYRAALCDGVRLRRRSGDGLVRQLWQAVRANRPGRRPSRAYAAETTQRREAQNQRDRAIKAEEDATANLARARAAVDDYLTTISESRLLKSPLPGLQPLRKELLTTALKYYEEFVGQNQDDPGLRADLAAAQLRVGRDHGPDRLEGGGPERISDRLEHVRVAGRSGPLAFEPLLQGRPGSLSRQDGDDPGQPRPSDESLRGFDNPSTLLDRLNREQAGDAASPCRPGPRAPLSGQDAHAATKFGRGNASPTSGHRSSQEPRGRVPEDSFRIAVDLALSLSNLGDDPDA